MYIQFRDCCISEICNLKLNRRDMKNFVMSPIPVTLGMSISAIVYTDLFESQ